MSDFRGLLSTLVTTKQLIGLDLKIARQTLLAQVIQVGDDFAIFGIYQPGDGDDEASIYSMPAVPLGQIEGIDLRPHAPFMASGEDSEDEDGEEWFVGTVQCLECGSEQDSAWPAGTDTGKLECFDCGAQRSKVIGGGPESADIIG